MQLRINLEIFVEIWSEAELNRVTLEQNLIADVQYSTIETMKLFGNLGWHMLDAVAVAEPDARQVHCRMTFFEQIYG